MRAIDVIYAKRFAQELTADQIRGFIAGYVEGTIPDYQASALLMAVAIHGLSSRELDVWTDAMLHSGRTVDLGNVPGIKVDKHSTGGVGDKISICLAPAVAACGVPVPMVSGRGLGHTGGTLDKLEAIPGFDVHLSIEEFTDLVARLGVCMIGQTEDLAPADRKMYALRDVTATVDSIPLISSSIMSKKLAEGIDALVLDVKVGSGAFMRRQEDAARLAKTLVGIGKAAGKRVTAYLTDMNQVLGREVGNANETAEAIAVLQGSGPDDIRELTVLLGAEMLLLGGIVEDIETGRKKVAASLDDGSALDRFRDMVAAQKGDPSVAEDLSILPQPKSHETIVARKSGFVASMDSRNIGVGAMLLGAGRRRAEDDVDHAVGVTVLKKVGDPVQTGEPLAEIHHNGRGDLAEARRLVAGAFGIQESPPTPQALVLDRISSK